MKFQVDTGMIAAAVTKLQSALDGISGERDKMFRALEEMEGMWIGTAHDAFAAQYTVDNEAMTVLINEIQDVIEKVANAGRSYDDCEENAKELADSIVI